jgi:hypothetical protein
MRELQVMSQMERRIVEKLADRIIPRGGSFALGARDVDIPRFVDDYLTGLPWHFQWTIRGMILLFHFATFPFARKVRPFTWLSASEQNRYIQSWEESSSHTKRAMLKLLVILIMMGFYRDAKVQQEIGYEPISESVGK